MIGDTEMTFIVSDAPRSLLMKYPLLIDKIKEKTPQDHPDIYYLEAAVGTIKIILYRDCFRQLLCLATVCTEVYRRG
jgi:hypothetical protein